VITLTIFGYSFISLFILYNIGEIEGGFVLASALIFTFLLEVAQINKNN
jgi:hypothetical protein